MTALDPDSASAQLRVIRSLMERATIYRSLSAPTALVGGLLSLVGFGAAYYARHYRHEQLSDTEFLVVWLVILILTGLTNAFFIWREARRRNEPFFSSGMKCAARSVAPAFLAAALATFILPLPSFDAIVWIGAYGMALLATQHFAPQSLIVLGFCFFVAGCACALFLRFGPLGDTSMDSTLAASWLMAATFGGFHLAYAAFVWALGGEKSELPAVSPNGAENV